AVFRQPFREVGFKICPCLGVSASNGEHGGEVVLSAGFLTVTFLAGRSFWQIGTILDEKELARKHVIHGYGDPTVAVRATQAFELLAHTLFQRLRQGQTLHKNVWEWNFTGISRNSTGDE